MPAGATLEPALPASPRFPDALDRAARDLAVAALTGTDPAVRRHRDRLLRADAAPARERGEEGLPSGLSAHAQHVVDATHSDPLEYHAATEELLERADLDPALRGHLEFQLENDPLRLAEQRMADSRRVVLSRVINSIAAAMGTSVTRPQLAPARLAGAALNLALAEHLEDPIRLQERQALQHWKHYVETHPETPHAPRLLRRIESSQRRWFETKRKRGLQAARRGLELGQYDAALLFADRTLRYVPEDAEATELLREAEVGLRAERIGRRRSLEAPTWLAPPAADSAARELATALLSPGADLAAAARRALAREPSPELARAARFALAIAHGEGGAEAAMWRAYRELAEDGDRGELARHADTLIESPEHNPYGAFRRARLGEFKARAGYVLFGPYAHGPRDLDLPPALTWLIELPAMIGSLGGIPNRLIETALRPPPSPEPAVHARSYLRRFPRGERARAMRRWLFDYQEGRGNWIAAHAIAVRGHEAGDSGFPATELPPLAERAARQGLDYARGQARRDFRLALLRRVADEYPDAEAGLEARRDMAELSRDPTTQRIRLSRGFLRENPVIAGPEGLGLRAGLLDGELGNGELHPEGITLVGQHRLEVALIPPRGNDEAPPLRRPERLAAGQLARLVALLDETSRRNALIEPLARVDRDRQRDRYFERARLGVASSLDNRPTARSEFTFLGVREQYKMVRSRISVLPFDLVIRGSLPDLGFGAFPRLRPPAETPDASLYR